MDKELGDKIYDDDDVKFATSDAVERFETYIDKATAMYAKAMDVIAEEARKETAKEVLDEVAKHYGGVWLIKLYKKYGVEVD